MKRLALLTALLVAVAAPAHALDDPEQTVRRLYAADSIPLKDGDIQGLLAADLAEAYTKDLRTSEANNEVGVVNDFDWRYDAQDFDIQELKFETTPDEAGLAHVTASFTNFDEPGTVTYDLCLGAAGWRISDVRIDAGYPWSMRDILMMPPDPLRC